MTDEEIVIEYLRESLVTEMKEHGGVCPVCDRFAKYYKRNLNSSMVESLKFIHNWYLKNDPSFQDWMFVVEVLANIPEDTRLIRGNFTSLKYWGLLRCKEEISPKDPRKGGLWKITEKGISFIKGEIQVPQYAILYNKECIDTELPLVYAHQCVEGFDYSETMKPI